MTERQAFDFEERKLALLAAHPVCEVCGRRPSVQLAHRIPQSKINLAMYGAAIIHHRFNIACVCGLTCNAAVNIGRRPEAVRRLVAEIRFDLGGA